MLLTETDAKDTWCPFARFGDNANNRWRQQAPEDQPYAVNPVPCRCIASACMAWRWQPLGQRMYREIIGGVTVHRADELGFCGLAGKPD